MAERYRSIARVAKAHGRKGEVVVVPTHGLPFLLKEGIEVALVPPQLRERRRFEVGRVGDSGSGQLVSFKSVTDLDGASSLVGRIVLAREADLPDDFALLNRDALVGREVVDEDAGVLGTISEVLVGPTQDVWVVDGDYGQVMVPVVDEFVVVVPEEGVISVRLPEGILSVGEGE